MPEDDITKQIEERLAQLPEDIQNAILASDFDQKMQAIGRTHNLHIDQAQQLGSEVLLVMLGASPMSSFADDIIREVHVSKDEAEKIITDINAQILAPIRESMKKTYEEGGTAPTAAQNPPVAEKSVVMPSATSTPRPIVTPATPPAPVVAPVSDLPKPPVVPTPVTNPPQAIVSPAPAAIPVPKAPLPTTDMHPAEIMLTEKTLQVPPPVKPAPNAAPTAAGDAAKPAGYKADPYREPIE